MIVAKVKTLAAKHKQSDSNNAEFKKEYNEILREGNDLAKEADRELRNKNTSAVQVSESVGIDKFNSLIINENGKVVDNVYDILSVIIEKVDCTEFDIYPILEYYCDITN